MNSNSVINITHLRVANVSPMRISDLNNLLELVTSGTVDLSQILSSAMPSTDAPIVATDAPSASQVDRATSIIEAPELASIDSSKITTPPIVADPTPESIADAPELVLVDPTNIASPPIAIGVAPMAIADAPELVLVDPNVNTLTPIDVGVAPESLAEAVALPISAEAAPHELPSPAPIASATIGQGDEIAPTVVSISSTSSTEQSVSPASPVAPASTAETIAVATSAPTEEIRAPDPTAVPRSLAAFATSEYFVNGISLGLCSLIRGRKNQRVRYSPTNLLAVYLWALDCFVVLKSYNGRQLPPHVTTGTFYGRNVTCLPAYTKLAVLMMTIGGRDLAERTFCAASNLADACLDTAKLLTGIGYPTDNRGDEPVPNAVLQRIEALREFIRVPSDPEYPERHFKAVMPNGDVKYVTLPWAYPTGEEYPAKRSSSALPIAITQGVSDDDLAVLKTGNIHKKGSCASMKLQSLGLNAWSKRSPDALEAYVNGKWIVFEKSGDDNTWKTEIGTLLRSERCGAKQFGPMDSAVRAYVFNVVTITETRWNATTATTSEAVVFAPPKPRTTPAKRKMPAPSEKLPTTTAANKKRKAPSPSRRAATKSSKTASRKQANGPGTASDSDSEDISLQELASKASRVKTAALVKLQTREPALARQLVASVSTTDNAASLGTALATLDVVALSRFTNDDDDDVVILSPKPTHMYVPIVIDVSMLATLQRLTTDPTASPLVKTLLESHPALRWRIAAGMPGLSSICIQVEYIEQSSSGAIDAMRGSNAPSDIAAFKGVSVGIVEAFQHIINHQRLPDRLTVGSVTSGDLSNEQAPLVRRCSQTVTINGVKSTQLGCVATADIASGETLGVYGARFLPHGVHHLDGATALYRMCGVSRVEAIDCFAIGGVKRKSDGVVGAATAWGDTQSVLSSANHSRSPNATLLPEYDDERGGVPVRATRDIRAGESILFDYGREYERISAEIGETLGEVGSPNVEPVERPPVVDEMPIELGVVEPTASNVELVEQAIEQLVVDETMNEQIATRPNVEPVEQAPIADETSADASLRALFETLEVDNGEKWNDIFEPSSPRLAVLKHDIDAFQDDWNILTVPLADDIYDTPALNNSYARATFDLESLLANEYQ